MKIPARALEGLPRAGQQHPELRVHHQRFVLGQAEETAIEELLHVVADEPLPGTREPAGAGEFTDGPIAPAVAVGDRLADDFAFAEQAPELLVGAESARQTVAVPHDGDGEPRRRSGRGRGIRAKITHAAEITRFPGGLERVARIGSSLWYILHII